MLPRRPRRRRWRAAASVRPPWSAYRPRLRVRLPPRNGVDDLADRAFEGVGELRMSALRCSACRCSAFNCSARSRSVSIMLFLNTSTAPAISPISSLRPRPGIASLKSPPREPGHGGDHRGQRPRDRAPDQQRQAAHEHDARQPERDQHRRSARTRASPLRSLPPACTAARHLLASTITRLEAREMSSSCCRQARGLLGDVGPGCEIRLVFCQFRGDLGLHVGGTATVPSAFENSAAAFFSSPTYFWSRRSMKSFSCRRIISIQLVSRDRRFP